MNHVPLLKLIGVLIIFLRKTKAQCTGLPTYILPSNSTGYLAFPESNYDPIGDTWKNIQQYPEGVTCKWILKAPPLHVFIVKMLHLNTEADFDFVKLFTAEDKKTTLYIFTGDLNEDWQAFTPDDTLFIEFLSDEYTSYHGFHLAFRYMPKACVPGGVSIEEPQLIALPPWNLQGILPGPHKSGFEAPLIGIGGEVDIATSGIARWVVIDTYPQDLNCTWHIDVRSKQLVQLDVLNFHTDEDDVLQIWQLDKTNELRPMVNFMSDKVSRNQIHSGNPLLLNFISRRLLNEQGTGSGFLLNITYISRGCGSEGQILNSPKGVIAYPSHNFVNGLWLSDIIINYGEDSCEWILVAPQGYSINVTIMNFETRTQDILEILEGNKTLVRHGGKLPDKREILSNENKLIIKFSSNDETVKTGFLLHYSWLLRSCQFELSPGEGELRSPYYPDTYGDNMKCQWKLIPPSGHVTQFFIYRLRLDNGDFLQITDTDGEKNVVFSQESSMLGLWEFPSSQPVMVNFISDIDNNKGYFMIKYDIFQPGSCNFSFTSCGYGPLDPLQAWEFKATERMIYVDESSLGIQLPRGYRTKLASPIIEPNVRTNLTMRTSQKHFKMCLKLEYIITGQDAFKLTVSMEEKQVETMDEKTNLVNWTFNSSRSKSRSVTLLNLHGPHGETMLNEKINFTAEKPFQIFATYERGYGPHYRVSINSIKVLDGPCEGGSDLSTFSCSFETSFCGWKNTHTDHRNWQLGNTGVTAMVNEDGGRSKSRKRNKLQKQIADLESPLLNKKDLVKESGESDLCLDFSYNIHTSLTELKVIVATVKNTDSASLPFFRSGGQEEENEIWIQGRVKSLGFLSARIPIKLKDLPNKFKVILRGASVTTNRQHSLDGVSNEMGISVQNIQLGAGKCSEMLNCDFSNGFCSWKTESDGNTVWHIRRSSDLLSNNTFAAIYSKDVPDKYTRLISPYLSGPEPRTISFLYHIHSTTQCLTVGVRTPSSAGSFTKVLWEQCKSKGNQWLYECIDLPSSEKEHQVVLQSVTGQVGSELWVDDMVISPGRCSHSTPEEKAVTESSPVWQCGPHRSLCGMTQPAIGLFDWEFYHLSAEGRSSYYQTRDPEQKGGRHLSHSFHESESFNAHSFDEQNNLKNHEAIHFENQRNILADLFLTGDHSSGRTSADQILPSDTVVGRDHQRGFACLDGRILDPSWACDGVPDCDDASDERGCNCGPEGCGNFEEPEVPLSPGICSEGTFRCPSGRTCPMEGCPRDISPCLPRSFLCDEIVHCIEGEDERSCGGVTREATLPHSLEWQNDAPHANQATSSKYFERRGANSLLTQDQASASKDRFECSGGLFLPKTFRCDGRKDCPLDGLDEVGCFHCGPSDFLCPTSGVCLPKSVVCDGDVSVQSCTDELFCHTCSQGNFACDVCLPSFKVCDGVWDCNEGEDEQRCLGIPSNVAISEDSAASHVEDAQYQRETGNPIEPFKSNCQDDHFKCSNERCLPISAVCDRKQDCTKGEDEENCIDDNKDVEFYITARPSKESLTQEGRSEAFPSYLITPVLFHKPNFVGLLSFHYRLDAWLGSSNATLSVELLEANNSRTSLIPWTLWRQSGHKGRLWLKTQVLIPEMPNIQYYRIGFLLTSNEFYFNSQQIHLAKITFNMISSKEVAAFGVSRSTCEFDGSWCGWSQSYTERGYSWVHAVSSPHARRTGPITGFPDEGSSGFVFADSLQGKEGDATDLMSPPLMLSQETLAICFRYAVFLFGAHVAKLSVHVMQVSSQGHPYSSELFQISGGKGLSWVPVSITIDDLALKFPEEPFILIVRATRGNGPEADIALDHVSLLEGRCNEKTKVNPDILLKPITSLNYAYVNSLSGGPSFTPFSSNANAASYSSKELKSYSAPEVDLCTFHSLCSECVSSSMKECMWCSEILSCVDESLSAGRRCHAPIWHITAETTIAGPSWCPRIIPDHSQRQFVPAESAITLSFPVTNIPASDTEGPWSCVFELKEEINNSVADLDKMTVNAAISSNVSKEKNDVDEDEELWNKLKQYALKKHQKAMVIKVSGLFKGSVFNAAEGHSEPMIVGVGAINCGDGETLFNLPTSINAVEAAVRIRSPSGRIIDNANDAHVVIYKCESLSKDCQTCVNLNTTFSCGWCAYTKSCTTHTKCTSGLWNSHSSNAHSYVCNVQDELDFLKNLLETEEDDQGFDDFEEEIFGQELDFTGKGSSSKMGGKRKVEKKMKKFLGNERENRYEDDEDARSEADDEDGHKVGGKKRGKKNKQGGTDKSKGNIKVGKKGKGRGFLKVPVQQGVFVARDVWRLHTGRQYYIPVTKKTLINLGFVRQVTYGSLSKEKSRTILVDGAWKKAAGFYIDLYEKADQDPVTSIIMTNKKTFEDVLTQLQPEKEEKEKTSR